MKVVVDALQVAAEFSGVGRQALSLGAELHRLPDDVEVELRCAAETLPVLRDAFPARTRFVAPISRSRPRIRRILYQQLIAPARDGGSMLLVCLGDQGPVWGRATVLLAVNDVRRLTHPETSGRVESAFYRALVPRAVAHASFVVTISDFSRGELARALGRDAAVRVLADHPRPRVTEPAGGADGPLLAVSALRPYKGAATVIEALARVDAPARREVVFVGSGEGQAAGLRALAARLGVDGLVRFEGWTGQTRLEELYAGAVASVSASTYEGYGLPVAESLSYGLPTVASDIPPHREVAADAALYFRPGDAGELAACLARLDDGQVRETLARRALERSRELALMGPRWADVILEALGRA